MGNVIYGGSPCRFPSEINRRIKFVFPFHFSVCNVTKKRISRRHIRFMQDMFTTLVDMRWRWTLLIFVLNFVVSWVVFAGVWWLISTTHGDLEDNHLPAMQGKSQQ